VTQDLSSHVCRIAMVRAVVESLGRQGWSRIRCTGGEWGCLRELLMVVMAWKICRALKSAVRESSMGEKSW